MNSKKTQKTHNYVDQIEALRDLGSDLKKTAKDQAVDGMISDLWKQMLGENTKGEQPSKGDLKQGEFITLGKKNSQEQEKAERKPAIMPGIDYQREILYGEQMTSRREHQETQAKMQEIIIELQRLTKSSQELEIEFKDVTVNEMPVNPGKYHLNFFEWMLSVVRNARMKVENSASWLSVFSSKKARKDYWSMAKSHGTSFTLNGERTPATQTG